MSETTFELTARESIPALNLEYRLYRHPGTGARHLHLEADDDNNAFMVAFPTIPSDSTGVAHILEHTTLCGSRRYPVRDPFFMMLRRSLNTFMNAFTGNDMTAYPFATCNAKDFENLLSVYLDCVFFPRLDELDFAQEGHRLEFSVPDDPSSPLVYRGVVYNEMKGAMSAPVAQLWHHLQSNLFPTTTYHFNSGGDPAAIPDLTYDALRRFHATHYHPSHAVFMTYGDLPAERHQKAFESLALRAFEPESAAISVPEEPAFTAPRSILETYAIGADEDPARQTHVCFGFVLGHTADPVEMLEAHLLDTVLLDNSSSPLRHFLEQTDLADAPSELCGLDDSARQTMFFAGVEGSEPEHADALERGMFEVLQRIADEGLDVSELETALDRLEMAQRDVGGDGMPYGLQLLGRALSPALYGGDPLATLDLDSVLAQLRERIADPGYFPSLVRRWLTDNPHRVRVVMTPDQTAAERAAAAERRRLEQVERTLDDAGRQRIVERALALAERQRIIDDPSLLPGLTLDDVPAGVHVITPRRVADAPRETLWFARGTNGVVHQRLVFDLPPLSRRELALLAAHNDVVSELGAGTQDYLQVSRARARAGEFSADVALRRAASGEALVGLYSFGVKGLARYASDAADRLYEGVADVRFDETDRLAELFSQAKADAEAELTDRGHSYAVAAAVGQLTEAGRVAELWGGVTNLRRAKGLAAADAGVLANLSEELAALHRKIAGAPGEVVLVGEEELEAELAALHAARAGRLPGGQGVAERHFELVPEDSGPVVWKTSARVNFCAKAWPAVPESHDDAPALAVLGGLIQNGFLHTAIREQGGAYGSGAQYDPATATFRMFSYRDPRLAGTLEDYRRALEFAAEASDEQLLTEAILGVIRGLDQPKSPAGDALTAYYNRRYGRDPEFLAAYREKVLGVGFPDLARVLDAYFAEAGARYGILAGDAAAADLEALGWEARPIRAPETDPFAV